MTSILKEQISDASGATCFMLPWHHTFIRYSLTLRLSGASCYWLRWKCSCVIGHWGLWKYSWKSLQKYCNPLTQSFLAGKLQGNLRQNQVIVGDELRHNLNRIRYHTLYSISWSLSWLLQQYAKEAKMTEIQEAVKFDTKKVYFFAGPHKCAGTSVEKFFAKWASDGYHAGHPKSAA